MDIKLGQTMVGGWVATMDGQAVVGDSSAGAMRALYRRTDHKDLVAQAGKDVLFFLEWIDGIQESTAERQGRKPW